MVWKKVHSGKRLTRYRRSNGNELEIYPERIEGRDIWFVAVSTDKTIADKEFETKSIATKFAMKYMDKHK